MRISRYAFLIEDQDEHYAYSTLSNSLLDIDKEDDYLLFKSNIMQLRAQRESMHLTLAPTMDCAANSGYFCLWRILQ